MDHSGVSDVQSEVETITVENDSPVESSSAKDECVSANEEEQPSAGNEAESPRGDDIFDASGQVEQDMQLQSTGAAEAEIEMEPRIVEAAEPRTEIVGDEANDLGAADHAAEAPTVTDILEDKAQATEGVGSALAPDVESLPVAVGDVAVLLRPAEEQARSENSGAASQSRGDLAPTLAVDLPALQSKEPKPSYPQVCMHCNADRNSCCRLWQLPWAGRKKKKTALEAETSKCCKTSMTHTVHAWVEI